ncbi:MAG: hypothetical protein ACREI3_10395 [Nitrospirales bacterium]
MFSEEKDFTFRFSLEATFPEEYEGEADNYAWLQEWERLVKPDLIKTIFEALRRHPAWTVHVRNRGVPTEDAIEIAVTRDFSTPPGNGPASAPQDPAVG